MSAASATAAVTAAATTTTTTVALVVASMQSAAAAGLFSWNTYHFGSEGPTTEDITDELMSYVMNAQQEYKEMLDYEHYNEDDIDHEMHEIIGEAFLRLFRGTCEDDDLQYDWENQLVRLAYL